MTEWIHDQIYHMNWLAAVIIIAVTTTISKANTMKELKSISQEFYRNVEEIKDEIRERD